jgi:chromosome segregation ATPase
MDGATAAIERVEWHIHGLNQGFDALSQRMDVLNERVETLSMRVGGLGERVDALSMRVDGLGERVETLGTRVDELNERVDRLNADVSELRMELRTGFIALTERVDEGRRHSQVLFESIHEDVRMIADGIVHLSARVEGLIH